MILYRVPQNSLIALGVGVGLGLVTLGVFIYALMPSNPSWNTKAIKATFVSSEFSATPAPAGYFTYTLENTTSKDFSVKMLEESHLPTNLRAAARRGPIAAEGAKSADKSTTSLMFGGIDFFLPEAGSDSGIPELANGEPLFIPAKQKVQIRLRWEFSPTELASHSSVSIVNTSLFGFVLYDDYSKYEIDFPPPPPLQGKFSEADVSKSMMGDKTVDPDTLKPWEMYASCAQAAKQIVSCKSAKIVSPYNKGWYVTPLPMLPSPPPGFTIVPAQSSCDDATQWQNFCATKK